MVTHILEYHSKLHLTQNRTVCGRWVPKREIAVHDEDATCPKCIQSVKEYDDLMKAAIADDWTEV